MLGKNPSEAAAAALVVMECDILRARGPSAEEIADAEEERKKEEARHQAEAEQAANEEAARLEKRRLQDEEITRQNEKLRIAKEKLAAQEQERAAEEKDALPEEPNRDFKNEMQRRYGGASPQGDAVFSPGENPYQGKGRLKNTPLAEFGEKAQKHLAKCAEELSPFMPEALKLAFRGGQVLAEEWGPHLIAFYKAYQKYDAIGKGQHFAMMQRLQQADPGLYRQYVALGIGVGVDPDIAVLCPNENLRDPVMALGRKAGYYAENGANYFNLGPGLAQDIGDVTTFLSVFLVGSLADAAQMNPLKIPGLKGLTSAEKSLVRSYVKQMELHAGMHMPKQQRDALANLLREKRFERLSPEEMVVHKQMYYADRKIQEKLRTKWTEMVGHEWPTYQSDVIGKNGKVLFKAGQPFQIHHIILQSHGGPHDWFNIFPLPMAGHQQGVHLKNAPGQILHLKK